MSLLPASASRLMHILAETLDSRLASIPVPGPEAMRPETAPESFVPFLAWGWSVDLWDADWPIERKRQITADALEMHRLKGTEEGIRRYLAYTDARDVRFTVPPQAFFASAGPESDPAWRHWIEGLPEIRLYHVRTPSLGAYAIAVEGGEAIDMPDNCFLGAESEEATFFAAGDLSPLEREYAVMITDGVEIPVSVIREPDTRIGKHGEVLGLYMPGEAGAGAFAGDMIADTPVFLDGAPAAPSALKLAFGSSVAVGEGWALVQEHASFVQDVEPEAGVFTIDSPIGLFVDTDFADDAILDIADADWGTYRAVRLIRPGLTMPPAASYLDADRLGMAAYTAEIRLALPETTSTALFYTGASYAGDLVAAPDPDLSTLNFAIDAVSAAQSARDRLLVDLNIPAARSLKTTRRLSSLSL